jgi:hypothetical protein
MRVNASDCYVTSLNSKTQRPEHRRAKPDMGACERVLVLTDWNRSEVVPPVGLEPTTPAFAPLQLSLPPAIFADVRGPDFLFTIAIR